MQFVPGPSGLSPAGSAGSGEVEKTAGSTRFAGRQAGVGGKVVAQHGMNGCILFQCPNPGGAKYLVFNSDRQIHGWNPGQDGQMLNGIRVARNS